MTNTLLGPRRRTVDTAGGPVSYLDAGEGPVALFVHGLGTNAHLWRHVIGELAGECRCVAIDLPLHGQTPAAPGRPYGLAALAAVLEEVCEALETGPIDLVAHDTGGAVAQIFAATHPGRLRSLCLTNCDTHDNVPPEAFAPTVELAATGALAASGPGLLEDLPATRELVFGSGFEEIDRLPLDVLESYLRPLLGTTERAREFERFILAIGPDDLLAVEDDLGRLTVPTLIVWATGDVFFDRSWATWLHELIPGATGIVEVEGGKLFFPDERAGELVDALRHHWAACP